MFEFPYDVYDLVDRFYSYTNNTCHFRTVIGETYVLDLQNNLKIWFLNAPATCEMQGWAKIHQGKLFPRDGIYVDYMVHDIVEITTHDGLYDLEIIPESDYPWSYPKEHIIIKDVPEHRVWIKMPINHGTIWVDGKLDKDRKYEELFRTSFIRYEESIINTTKDEEKSNDIQESSIGESGLRGMEGESEESC